MAEVERDLLMQYVLYCNVVFRVTRYQLNGMLVMEVIASVGNDWTVPPESDLCDAG